jgi:hypothetical protein
MEDDVSRKAGLGRIGKVDPSQSSARDKQMATSETAEQLDIRKKLAHIDLMLAQNELAQTQRINQETQFAPWQIVLTSLGAGAALFAAGAAFMKLMG